MLASFYIPGWSNFCSFYSTFNKSNALYVKIDDDILYFHPKAIFLMAQQKLSSNNVLVSANVVNHAALSRLHSNMGLFNSTTICTTLNTYESEVREYIPYPPYNFDGSPYGHHSWRSGPHASLQHTVFLRRKSCNNISSYDFGLHDFNTDGTYARWSINMFVFQGGDISEENLRQLCYSDDEAFLSISLPNVLHKHSTSVGGAVAVHFAYSSQR